MAELAEPEALRCLGTPGDERQTWDEMVRDHVGEMWARALAGGLSRADAAEVCELVWRNAAQRVHTLHNAVEVREFLMESVTREGRRMARLRALQSGRTRRVRGETVIRLDEWMPAACVGFGTQD